MNWIAFLFVLAGNLLVGNKKKVGFLAIGVGSILWMVIGFQINDYALVMVNVTGTIIMVRNWLKWKAAERYWQNMILSQYRTRWWQVLE